QARMGSTRLPGKILKKLEDKPVLAWVITRLKQCMNLNDIIVATTKDPLDDIVVRTAHILEVPFYRGATEDVLSRFYYAAIEHNADIIVRICSDCPFIDYQLLDQMVAHFLDINTNKHIDYLSNTLERTYPRGLDVEIFFFKTLEKAQRHAKKLHQREHVTPFIYENPSAFNIQQYKTTANLAHHRWTLDTLEDWNFFETVIAQYKSDNKVLINTETIIESLEQNPEIYSINQHIKQKAIQNIVNND
ncbi:MAG TPA: glycosyltransferase family protein, partial [Gammaproteobacteria bacterium]|nr:glycosyltransferase family protein [Gammaproteobacteria bacterium]